MADPDADTVELWVWRLEPAKGDATLLSPDERNRAERFHFDRDRERFVAGRARLRRILGDYRRTDPAALRFGYNAAGKPVLDGGPCFNLSHSHGLAALAVAGFALGIDIERLRLVEEDIAGRFFAADEAARLQRIPAPQRAAAFLACWTRKEAYVKALGDGLLAPLDRFSVSLDRPARLLHVAGDAAEASRWQLADIPPADGFAGAIAARRTGWRLRWRQRV